MKAPMSRDGADIRNVSPSFVRNHTPELPILDVRTWAEFEEAHIQGSVLRSLDELDSAEVSQIPGIENGCVLVCQSGTRARQAARILSRQGLKAIHILKGGIAAWESARFPLVRGKKTISLERQVRIAAGTLALTGALLGYFIHPAWIALSACVGAGLIFAGITDTCGLGMLLTRMPWNARRPSCSAPTTSNTPEVTCTGSRRSEC